MTKKGCLERGEAIMARRRCVAIYDYDAVDREELTIRKNDQLTILDSEGSWWKVNNDRGGQGLVPCNYVNELQPVSVQIRQTPDEPVGMYQQTDLVKTSNGPFLNIPAVAKYRYAAKREDELGLEKGDNLIVLEKEQDGWWRGRCGNRIGWFPFNYVEELPPQAIQSSQPQIDKPVICVVRALYSFNSGNPEELAFSSGDILEITDQPVDDPEWWEARKSDKTMGLIPRNYVDIVPDSKPMGQLPIQTSPMFGSPGVSLAQGSSPPFAHEIWYYGKMARKDAERKLTSEGRDGEFLVRESETKVGFVFVIL